MRKTLIAVTVVALILSLLSTGVLVFVESNAPAAVVSGEADAQ